ncbi:adenylate/guanylate cyclase domain-containing protein [Nocardioides terrisoli]|uniref:adenylate/guanylate cyclase domain-containing protein n=1 Tax=Nocardioides terrisoli TaxID=3388267 RepID=UPI00287B5CB1|nr:adenylate/guanylate cyclase domain-containing protein [Nocardioides marmorisolisilvae]
MTQWLSGRPSARSTVAAGLRMPRLPSLWWVRGLLAVLLILVNLSGSVIVFCLAALVVPMPAIAHQDGLRVENLVLAGVYVLVAIVIGVVRGAMITSSATGWLRADRAPVDADRRAVLRAPGRLAVMQAALWCVGAAGFGAFNARVSVRLGLLVVVIVLLAGLANSAVAYLVAERALRPYARLALASGVPPRVGIRWGVRTLLSWALGSGIISLGICLAGLTSLTIRDVTTTRLALTMVVLGGTGFLAGGLPILLATKAGSDPVRSLRAAITQVNDGNFDADVPIYDATELGVLQAGFNDMLRGLRERETIRDLFGRHVGDDVARSALASGVQLGGEVRRVGVLFVDIVGSTSLAGNRPPDEVVALLNRFFDVVIEVVHRNGGWINKFEGDAALAVWGAPVPIEDMETAVLRTARELGVRLQEAVPELRAGIGVSAGDAVAGNVGAARRYEYTVIGDPVNEAARLTDLAKDVPAMVLANATMLEAAPDEAAHWEGLAPVVVRGRSTATEIATPRAG